MMSNGYYHPTYAYSLAEWGRPCYLPRCEGWILERPLPGLPDSDAMGCYPLFCCNSWDCLADDLADIGPELVSLAVVTDPFGEYDEALLHHAFPDLVMPFKQHYVVDLVERWPDYVRPRHRTYARQALTQVRVELTTQPLGHRAEWTAMYQHLINRHQLQGIHTFSALAFTRQLTVPGLLMFRALRGDECVAIQLWYQQGETVYSHLLACTPVGYELRAMYALYWEALAYFHDHANGRIRRVNLGGSAGIGGDKPDGLGQFKRGWATSVRQVYFCGRILNRSRYEEIVSERGVAETNYFPAYRQGEFKHENQKTD